MKSYTLTPTLNGIVTDDELYFEGIRRPQVFFSLRDGDYHDGRMPGENIEILEKYLYDIHNLFLKKLSSFVTEESTSIEESLKLQALLQEMIKVKNLIEAAGKAGDERTQD